MHPAREQASNPTRQALDWEASREAYRREQERLRVNQSDNDVLRELLARGEGVQVSQAGPLSWNQ
jgi:hypothetical protein